MEQYCTDVHFTSNENENGRNTVRLCHIDVPVDANGLINCTDLT
jgi:hypothetical protein